MKLSVLICTRNRAKSLEATLKRFFAQRFAGNYDFELVVVDNDSHDGTRRFVEQCAVEHPSRVRYCHEPRQGQCYARNTAIAAADGEIVIFTDDDVLVDETWLDEIHREFASDQTLYLLGGRVLPAREGLQNVAIQTSDERQIFVFPHSGNFAMGANMAFRKDILDRIGLFDVRLGPGRFHGGADDTDFFYRALKAGYKLLYAPNVVVYHDHNRSSIEQACQLEYTYNKGCSAYLLKHALQGDAYARQMILWQIYVLPKRWVRKDGESEDALRRRRAQIRGIIVGMITAPLVLINQNAQ
jgi:glycosyltransferase involved in cell wall biosynthesis